MLALANSVGLFALSRSDRHVLALLLCAALIALCYCCTVLAVDARKQCSYHTGTKKKIVTTIEKKIIGENIET